MNGSAQCVICREVRSDTEQLGAVGGKMLHACDAHLVEGRARLTSLRLSEAALRNARKIRERNGKRR